MKIYKYKLQITDEQVINIPRGSKFLSAQIQHGTLCVWAMVNSFVEKVDIVLFRIHGTDHKVTNPKANFIDTVQDGSLVWHIFWEKT